MEKERLSAAQLGAMELAPLYALHQELDAGVSASRLYQQDIHDVIVAKEAASRVHGPAELAQRLTPGRDIIDWLKDLPAELQQKVREHFAKGEK